MDIKEGDKVTWKCRWGHTFSGKVINVSGSILTVQCKDGSIRSVRKDQKDLKKI